VRFFLSPVAAVFLPASFFSGALEAVAGALEAEGFFSAALGGILIDFVWLSWGLKLVWEMQKAEI
jgi:hypothetical protein